MIRKLAIIAGTVALSACTTPQTVMRHPTTGQVVTCGGNSSASFTGGLIGYHMAKSTDSDCVAIYAAQGFYKVDERN